MWPIATRLCSIDMNSCKIVGIEGPGVDDLLALRVDHLDPLAFANADGFTFARRDFDHRTSPLGLTVDEFSGAC